MNTRNHRILIFISLLLMFYSCSKKMEPQTIELSGNWAIQSNVNLKDEGIQISSQSYDASQWIKTTVPNTILAAQVEAGIYTDIYKDRNLEAIDVKQYAESWWYRTEFNIEGKQQQSLIFEGINYRANIWLNGNLIADSSAIEGAFGIWKINVTDYIVNGTNTLAVQVFPPKFNDLTIGFVDWNPAPPDKNMGIWRPVKLESTGIINIDEPFVTSNVDTKTLNNATLTISTTVTNNSNKAQTVNLAGQIETILFEKTVQLEAFESRKVEFVVEEYPQLNISNPRLWWPNLMGEPNLYSLAMQVQINNQISDKKTTTFGIRKIEDYINPQGHRGYIVNGKEVLIKGAGWVDDMLLADADSKVKAQLEYVKHMNLNCVRLEGFWGRNKTIYETADSLGLLIMIGWSCQWEWEGYCGRYQDDFMCIRTPEDMELQARAYQSQVKWLRNHPSVFLWVYGSDKLPLPALEALLNTYIQEVDTTRPILASCKYEDFDIVRDNNGKLISGYANHSQISGSPGVKMLGPYAYTTPNYWYIDKKAGGAYGFNTETGPGPQVPPIESLRKMISEEHLWPMGTMWDYHLGRNEFATLNRYLEAFDARYGKATDVEDFAFRSQISNYEAIRAMFEAFEVNKPNTTGLIQWMLNSAWPEMFWQLYDWYLMPNGAFYGTKTACQPINAIYNYGNNSIYLTNSLINNKADLNIESTVYNINSKVVYQNTLVKTASANSSNLLFELPEFKDLSSTYFLNLVVKEKDVIIARNFYWLSKKPDVQDWKNSKWFYTPYKSYADFTMLNQLEKTKVTSDFSVQTMENGDKQVTCILENSSDKVAFFIELAIKDKATQEPILPVFWDDNYVSLMPGEKRQISARLQKVYVQNKELLFSVKGLNLN